MPRLLTLTGTVTADRQSEVAASVSGRVVATPIERGRLVKAGETLAIVDSKAAGFSVAASAAQADLAVAQVNQAEEDCARAERLFKEGAIAEAEYKRQQTQCKTQILQATSARAQAELSAKLAGDTIIRAPFSGAIGERYVNAGEYVQPSSKVASIYALDPVRVTVSVPEPAVGKVKQGQTLELHVAAAPDRTFPATVVFLSPALRANTRDLLVEAKAPNPDGALRPGMFATVELTVGRRAGAHRARGCRRQPKAPSKRSTSSKRAGVRGRGSHRRRNRAAASPCSSRSTSKTQVIRRPPPGLRDGAAVVLETSPTQGAAGARPAR